MQVDLAPLANAAIIVAAGVLTPVGAWLGMKVANWLHLRNDDKARAVLESAIQYGIQYGLSRAQEASRQGFDVDIKNETIASAVNYVAPKVPAAMARLKITPDSLAQIVETRLPADQLKG